MELLKLEKLPMSKDDIYKYLDDLPNKMVEIDLNTCEFESYTKMMNYLANCQINNAIINVDYNDPKTDEFIKAYIQFDRRVNANNINEAILSVVYENENPIYLNEDFSKFIDRFRKANKDLIEDIHDFFYNLNLAVSSAIVIEDKDLAKKIDEAPVVEKMSNIGMNLVNMCGAMKFGSYISELKRDIKHYNEFYIPNIEGRTWVTYMIDTFLAYKAMFIYNDITRHPEKREALQDQLNKTMDYLKKNKKWDDEMCPEGSDTNDSSNKE